MNSIQSQLFFLNRAPLKSEWGENIILIYDSFLDSTPYRQFIQKFPIRYKVTGGEQLKSIDALPGHLRKLSQLSSPLQSRDLTFVVLGGGSVGDFGAFVASIFKRGVRLVMIPSTWLAAIDSSHGGKTALNINGTKNQIGSFYPASEVYLFRDLLLDQPPRRVQEAFGEVVKMGLIAGGPLWKKISCLKNFDSKKLWLMLPQLIAEKYKIVKKDPFEKREFGMF